MELIQIDRQTERIARLCHALANPLRVAIVRYIASYPRCICNDIVVRTDRAQSTISQHLRVLIQAGLIETEQEGQTSVYWLAEEALKILNHGLEALSRPKPKPPTRRPVFRA